MGVDARAVPNNVNCHWGVELRILGFNFGSRGDAPAPKPGIEDRGAGYALPGLDVTPEQCADRGLTWVPGMTGRGACGPSGAFDPSKVKLHPDYVPLAPEQTAKEKDMGIEQYLGPIAAGLGEVIGGPLGEFAGAFGEALVTQSSAPPVASPNQQGPTATMQPGTPGGPILGTQAEYPGVAQANGNGAGTAVGTGLTYDIYGGADYAVSAKEAAFHELFRKGYIPLQSEPGMELAKAGHKPCKVRISTSAGPVVILAFKFGIKGKCRRKRVNLTRGRLADAAWVHRKLAGQVKLAKRFASSATKQLRACAPRSRGACVAVRKTTCKKR